LRTAAAQPGSLEPRTPDRSAGLLGRSSVGLLQLAAVVSARLACVGTREVMAPATATPAAGARPSLPNSRQGIDKRSVWIVGRLLGPRHSVAYKLSIG